jgi:hypothetical protein
MPSSRPVPRLMPASGWGRRSGTGSGENTRKPTKHSSDPTREATSASVHAPLTP